MIIKRSAKKKREASTENIDNLIEGICDGTLVMQADKTIVHKLKFPTDGEIKIEELTYKARLKMSAIHSHLQGIKSADADGRVCAYVAALSGKPKDIIKALDTEDYSIAQSVAIFFI